MKELQTIGQEYHKGFCVKIYYSNSLELSDRSDSSLFQILYIDEGAVVVGNEKFAKTLITPALLCLNYHEEQNTIHLSNAKGFSLFFKPEAINHGLTGDEIIQNNRNSTDYLAAEELLIYPFQKSNKNNPISLSVNGSIRERLLRMASNIDTQFNKQPDDYWPCRGRSFVLEMLMLLQSMFKLQSDNSIEINISNSDITNILLAIHTNYSDSSFSEKNLNLGTGITKLKNLFLFKKAAKKFPLEYLKQLRFKVACFILKNTSLPISEIVRRTGYNSEKTFCSDFFKQTKLSPLAWRSKFPNPYG